MTTVFRLVLSAIFTISAFGFPGADCTFTKAGQVLQLTKTEFLTQMMQKKVLSTGGRKIAGEMIGKLATTTMCFVPGTKIKTQDGLRNIEDIHADMMVWSRDEFSGESVWKRVAQTFVTHPTRIHHLTYALRAPPTWSAAGSTDTPVRLVSTETLGVTAPHPFWVSSRPQPGFVPAEELQAGDVLSLADGGSAEVTANLTEDAPAGSTFTTYNFEVEDFHTYFAGEAGVWVHNDCPAKDKIASVFFQKAKQLKQGGGGELAGKRFNALLDTKKELIGTHGICETNWREAAKDVSDKMLKDFKDGKIADVAHLPTVEDWNKKYFKDVLKGAKTPDGVDVHHAVEKWIQSKLGISPTDQVPGAVLLKSIGQPNGHAALQGRLRAAISSLSSPDEIVSAMKAVYNSKPEWSRIWPAASQWLIKNGVSIP